MPPHNRVNTTVQSKILGEQHVLLAEPHHVNKTIKNVSVEVNRLNIGNSNSVSKHH
jgi:hypothetical protein